jgi:hypothetical protein
MKVCQKQKIEMFRIASVFICLVLTDRWRCEKLLLMKNTQVTVVNGYDLVPKIKPNIYPVYKSLVNLN